MARAARHAPRHIVTVWRCADEVRGSDTRLLLDQNLQIRRDSSRFVDHQVGLYSGVRDIAVAELKHNVVALAKAARVFKLPLVVTTTAARSMWGPTIPELAEVLPPDLEIIDRSTVNAWDEPRVKAAIQATGRKKLIITGISTEVCLAFPAISATAEGYDAYAAIDASGTFWQAKREAGLLRMQQAGVIPMDYATAMIEILADNADPLAADVYAALDMPFAVLVGQIASALTKK
jgi:nicotinamidase-related amidase